MNSTERPAVHVPVLLERVTELLAPACAADGAVLVDATLGLAGHRWPCSTPIPVSGSSAWTAIPRRGPRPPGASRPPVTPTA